MERKRLYLDIGRMNGSVTVEMAYMTPILLLIFLFTVRSIFYYHDKVILNGTAEETAAAASQYARALQGDEVDFEDFFKDRIEGKLVLLRLTSIAVEVTEDRVKVSAKASLGNVCASSEVWGCIPNPEKKIRGKRKLESLPGKEIK